MIVNNKLLGLFFLLTVAGWAQPQVSVPSVRPPCEGLNCSDNPYDEDTRSSTDPSALPQDQLRELDRAHKDQLRGLDQDRRTQERKAQPGGTALSPVPMSEFQKFIFTSTGRHLPIYGQSLFETAPSTFAPVDHVPVPADYTIGPNDELL